MHDTWRGRDLPVLAAIVSAFEDPDRYMMQFAEIVHATDLSDREVQASLRALVTASPPLIEAVRPPEELTYPLAVTGVTERARRTVGQWPSPDDVIRQITDDLTVMEGRETDPHRRKRLHEAKLVVGGTARDIMSEVIAKVILGAGGMG